MRFEDNDFLSNLAVTRIDVTSHRVGKDKHVESRFGMWGELGFGPKFSGITGIRRIEYENAALIMSQARYQIDVGKVRVDWMARGTPTTAACLPSSHFSCPPCDGRR